MKYNQEEITRLLHLLDNEEIQDKIITIMQAQKEKKLLKKAEEQELMIEKLKEWICGKDKKIDILEETNKSLEAETEKLLKIKEENKKHILMLQEYELNFKNDLEMYNNYKKFTFSTQESLKGIFKDETLQGFLTCGVQEKNISSLYEYVKNELIEATNPDNKHLILLYNFFLDRFLLAYPIYKKTTVKVGDMFDTSLHIKVGNGVHGKINQVFIEGFLNIKQENIVKKSIVSL